MATSTCLEEQQDTFTAPTCTGWTWPPGSGHTSNPTMHPQIYLKRGQMADRVWTDTVHVTYFESGECNESTYTISEFIILQVQTWTCSWRTEDIHLRRWDFLDIVSLGQGNINEYTDQQCVTPSYPLLNNICPHQIHAYNLETNYWEEIVTKPHEKIGLCSMFFFPFFLNKGCLDSLWIDVVFMTGYPAARRCHSCVQVKNGKVEFFTSDF